MKFEDGRSLFDLIRLKDEFETLLGRSVRIVTEKTVHSMIREDIIRESVELWGQHNRWE